MRQFAPIERPRRVDWRERLDEMEVIARAVARGAAPDRGSATAYLEARADLLASEIADRLPGFLLQCHSILRLREFLTLYDPEPPIRETFMMRAFARCRAAIGDTRPAAKPSSREWMS